MFKEYLNQNKRLLQNTKNTIKYGKLNNLNNFSCLSCFYYFRIIKSIQAIKHIQPQLFNKKPYKKFTKNLNYLHNKLNKLHSISFSSFSENIGTTKNINTNNSTNSVDKLEKYNKLKETLEDNPKLPINESKEIIKELFNECLKNRNASDVDDGFNLCIDYFIENMKAFNPYEFTKFLRAFVLILRDLPKIDLKIMSWKFKAENYYLLNKELNANNLIDCLLFFSLFNVSNMEFYSKSLTKIKEKTNNFSNINTKENMLLLNVLLKLNYDTANNDWKILIDKLVNTVELTNFMSDNQVDNLGLTTFLNIISQIMKLRIYQDNTRYEQLVNKIKMFILENIDKCQNNLNLLSYIFNILLYSEQLTSDEVILFCRLLKLDQLNNSILLMILFNLIDKIAKNNDLFEAFQKNFEELKTFSFFNEGITKDIIDKYNTEILANHYTSEGEKIKAQKEFFKNNCLSVFGIEEKNLNFDIGVFA